MSDTPNGILPAHFERWIVSRLHPFVVTAARSGLSPDSLTLISLIFGFAAAVCLVAGYLRLAVIPVVLAGGCDILDGQVAHLTGKTSRFGAILDSSLDRYIEFLLLGGVGIHFYRVDQPWWTLVCALALVGSFMVSYVKARSEGAGIACPVGLLQRAERMVMLGAGFFFGGWLLKGVIAVLAILSHVTAVERLIHIKKAS
jgi:phosphatidylglycerophosphate synthase